MLKVWKQQFFDRSIDPVFPQLERKKGDISDIDLSRTIIHKFVGKRMQDGSIRSTLDLFGWRKGPSGDGGRIECYLLPSRDLKMEAVMELDGVAPGYGWGLEETLNRLYLIDLTKLKNDRWRRYPADEKDELFIPLNKVPAFFLQEVLAAVESIKPWSSN